MGNGHCATPETGGVWRSVCLGPSIPGADGRDCLAATPSAPAPRSSSRQATPSTPVSCDFQLTSCSYVVTAPSLARVTPCGPGGWRPRFARTPSLNCPLALWSSATRVRATGWSSSVRELSDCRGIKLLRTKGGGGRGRGGRAGLGGKWGRPHGCFLLPETALPPLPFLPFPSLPLSPPPSVPEQTKVPAT
jgi:hypothetical protein